MSNDRKHKIGAFVWIDLTVSDAEKIRDFYCQVIGWSATDHPMGEYADYNIHKPDGEVITGICHKAGPNSSIPPQWLNYVSVQDVTDSARICVDLGGKVIDGPRKMGASNFCIIQDPAGAIIALIDAPDSGD